MTLGDILSGQKPADNEITKRLKYRTLKSRIATRTSAIPTDFLANIERTAEAIAKGDLGALGLWEIRETSSVKEETKKALMTALGVFAQKRLEKFDDLIRKISNFKGDDEPEEKKEEPKAEIQIAVSPEVQQAATPSVFGY